MRYIEVTAKKIEKQDFLDLERDYVHYARQLLKGMKLSYYDFVLLKKKNREFVKNPEKAARWDLWWYMREIMRREGKIQNHENLMDKLRKQGINDNHLDRYLAQFTKKL